MKHSKITYDIIKATEIEWCALLNEFEDSTIYQTNAFVRNSIGGKNSEKIVVKKNNEVIAIAHIRIKTIPIINRGVAYLRWGPIWRKKNKIIDKNNFQVSLELLHKEYVIKRKLVLRIASNCFMEDEIDFTKIFIDAGFKKYQAEDKTILIDLSPDTETLRKNLHKKWRSWLRKAEQRELTVIQSSEDCVFDEFINIYNEMHSRKNFAEHINVKIFKKINSELQGENKLQIFICKKNSTLLSAVVVSSLGNSGIYLLGGTSSEGLKMPSSHLLQWKTMMWLKSQGQRWYDLGGIDSINNHGVYKYKSGMGGKEVTFIGGFEASENLISSSILNLKDKLSKKD